MQTKHYFLLWLSLTLLVTCQQKPSEQEQEIKRILEKQLARGIVNEEAYYNKEDLLITLPMLDTLLINNGYIKPSQEVFRQRIKELFSVDIQAIKDTVLYINTQKGQCFASKEKPNYLLSEGYQLINQYIILDKGFITELYPLPELLDYQQLYPELARQEESYKSKFKEEIKLYKEKTDLARQRQENHQRMLARNKYFFNNDQSQLVYLQEHDLFFLARLVKNFGYTKDTALVRAVLDKYDGTVFSESSIGDLIFVRDCNKQLKVRKEILTVIEELTKKRFAGERKLELDYVFAYLFGLSRYMDGIDHLDFAEDEKLKIRAYVMDTNEKIYEKVYGQRDFGTAAGYIRENPEVLQQLKQKNYFGLDVLRYYCEEVYPVVYEVEEPIDTGDDSTKDPDYVP